VLLDHVRHDRDVPALLRWPRLQPAVGPAQHLRQLRAERDLGGRQQCPVSAGMTDAALLPTAEMVLALHLAYFGLNSDQCCQMWLNTVVFYALAPSPPWSCCASSIQGIDKLFICCRQQRRWQCSISERHPDRESQQMQRQQPARLAGSSPSDCSFQVGTFATLCSLPTSSHANIRSNIWRPRLLEFNKD